MVAGITHRDTTLCKLFVGGLPYHTSDDTLKAYFDQFGEIEEAVVITDRQTCKSKGYGFVTMYKPEDAQSAIQDPNPIIDGRKANVNLAYLGAKPVHTTSPRGVSPNGLLMSAPPMAPLYYFPVNHPLPNMLPPQVHIPLPRQHSPTHEFPPTVPIMPAAPEYFLPYMPHPHPSMVPQQMHAAFQPHGIYAPTMFPAIVQ